MIVTGETMRTGARRARRATCSARRASSTSSTSPRSTRKYARADAAHEAASGIHRRELLRLSGRAADLVLLMDEAHRYRAKAGMQAPSTNLKPILGLELTATPQDRRREARPRFKNVIYRYQPRRRDGRRLRQGTGRRHAQGLRSRIGDAERARTDQARRRHPLPREHQGGAGHAMHARPAPESSVHAGRRRRTPTHAEKLRDHRIRGLLRGTLSRARSIRVHSSAARRGKRRGHAAPCCA